MDYTTDFEQYWSLMQPDARYQDRRKAASDAWSQASPDKRQAIMEWLQEHGAYPQRNPYFFILDFRVSHPQEEPTNYNGKALKKGVEYATAFYNGKWGMYTKDDIQKFNLQTKK